MQAEGSFKSVIVTVNWNKLELIKQLVEALKNQENQDFALVVVDNGSTDGSREYLIRESSSETDAGFPIYLLLLSQNTGFAVPNNLGINYAIDSFDPEYIVLLNNDTIPDPDFIKKLYAKADSYLEGIERKNLETDKRLFPFLSRKNGWKIGCFAPLVINYYAKNRVDAAGIRISPDGNAINRGVGENFFKFKREKEVFGPSGSAVLFLKKALTDVALPALNIALLKGWSDESMIEENIFSVRINPISKRKGNFDTNSKNIQKKEDSKYQILPLREFFASRYFAYFEDVDLAWRLRLRYWGCVYIPEARILHYHSATAKSYSLFKSYHVHRNQYFNIIRDFPSTYFFKGFGNAFKRYYYLLLSLRKKKGPAAQLAENSSKIKVIYVTIKGWCSVLRNLYGLLKERQEIQSTRLIEVDEFKELLNSSRFHASMDQMIFDTHDFLQEQKKSDEEGKARND